MMGLAFASVPLYRLFCQVTGYQGTTQRADTGVDRILDREVVVRFDANVSSGLPWDFKPARRDMTMQIGETAEAHYTATNLFDTPTAHGVWRLACWGRVGRGRLLPQHDPRYATTVTEDTLRTIAPIRAIVDAITARALVGPTELLPDELAMS